MAARCSRLCSRLFYASKPFLTKSTLKLVGVLGVLGYSDKPPLSSILLSTCSKAEYSTMNMVEEGNNMYKSSCGICLEHLEQASRYTNSVYQNKSWRG